MVRFPCKGCEDRKPRCHSTCERYQAAKEERAMENKNRRKEDVIKDYTSESIRKAEKRR